MELKGKVRSGTNWLVLRTIVGAVASLVTTPLIARLLTLEEYGAYSLLFALIPIVGTIAGFGVFPSGV